LPGEIDAATRYRARVRSSATFRFKRRWAEHIEKITYMSIAFKRFSCDLSLLASPQFFSHQLTEAGFLVRPASSGPNCTAVGVFDAADKVKDFEAGGVDHIIRPFEPQEVLVRIRPHLRVRVLVGHLEQEVNQRTAELIQANQQRRRHLTEHRRVEEELSWAAKANRVAAELSRALLSSAPLQCQGTVDKRRIYFFRCFPLFDNTFGLT
jgi:hypothetical protein